jgi:hypothetical protein
VLAEWASGRGFPRAIDPAGLVLPRRSVGRPHQRRDREAAGPASLETREQRPDAVVQGPLDVARDDGGE